MMNLAVGLGAGKAVFALHSVAVFQAEDAINSGNSKLLMIFVGLVAFALLVQAAVMVGLAIVGVKAQKAVMAEIADIKGKVMPLVEKSQGLIADLGPQVKEITAKTNTLIGDVSPHVKDITVKVQTLIGEMSPKIVGITAKVESMAGHAEQMTGMARDKVLAFGPTVDAANETALKANETVRGTIVDAGEKTRAQVERVNGLVTGILDSTVKIAKAIEYGVTQPVKEVGSFVSGAKGTVEHLIKHYGSAVSLSGIAGMFGFGKKKPVAPSPYSAAKPASPTEVNAHNPRNMGSADPGLPSAFGSTRRDLDL